MLEQILCGPRKILTQQQFYSSDKPELWGVARFYTSFYSGKIDILKIGMGLPGGLNIKDLTKNSIVLQGDFGGIGNIYTFHPDGHGSIKFYGNECIDGIKQGKDREKKTTSW